MLKFLVGAACVAVLAYAGYFFWGEYQAYKRAELVAEYTQQRSMCLTMLDIYARAIRSGTSTKEARTSVDACINDGYIRADDVNAAAK